jgi:hypothetical protein
MYSGKKGSAMKIDQWKASMPWVKSFDRLFCMLVEGRCLGGIR